MNEGKIESKGEMDPRNTLNDLSGKDWVKHTISWFTLKVRPRSKDEKNHPGKFPEELCLRFIEYFTKRGQWVIDPFAGTGSTLIASRSLGRNAVGIELNREFAEIAARGLNRPSLDATFLGTKQRIFVGDARKLPELLQDYSKESFHLCMTSPPYWNMLGKLRGGSDSQHRKRAEIGLNLTYSNSADDVGNIEEYEEYLGTLGTIFRQLKSFLASGAYLIIILQNIRDEKGEMRPLAWDLARKLSDIYKQRQEQIWCQTDKPAGIWGYPKTYVSNVHHHYALVFQKTDVSQL